MTTSLLEQMPSGSNRVGVCPVCGNTDDRCRQGDGRKSKSKGFAQADERSYQQDGSYLQMCWNRNSRELPVPSNVRFIKPLQGGGMGGLFAVYPGVAPDLNGPLPEGVVRISRPKERVERKPLTAAEVKISNYLQWAERQREEAEALELQLMPVERDTEYRRLAEMMGGLSDRHLKTMLDRGMWPGVEKYARENFVSWWGTKEIPGGSDPRLPGVSSDGKRTRAYPALAIPALTPTGKVVGYQIMGDEKRFDDKGKQIQKYIWLSSASPEKGKPGSGGAGPNIGSESPLFCWVHPLRTGEQAGQIWFCEGALKSFLLASYAWSQGWADVVVIAAGGANQLSASPKILRRYMDMVDPSGTCLMRFWPDAGAIENERVAHAYASFFALIATIRKRENLEIGWWGQASKAGALDCDEMWFGGSIASSRIKIGQIVRLTTERAVCQVVAIHKPERNHDLDGGSTGGTMVEVYRKGGNVTIPLAHVQAVPRVFSAIDWLRLDEYLSLHPLRFVNEIQDKIRFVFIPKNPGLRWTQDPTQSPMLPIGELSGINMLRRTYDNKDRVQVWEELISDPEKRQRFVLDSSGTGEGKSHSAGMIDPAQLRGYASKVVYVTNDPLNVTTPTLSKENGWEVLRGRDYGRKAVEVDGQVQLRRAERGADKSTLAMQANCMRNGIAELLASRQVPAMASNLCRTCPARVLCLSEGSEGLDQYSVGTPHGYLADRKKAMRSNKVIAHIKSLELNHLEPGETVALIIDEASKLPWIESYSIPSIKVTESIISAQKQVFKSIENSQVDWDQARGLEKILDRLMQEYRDRLPSLTSGGRKKAVTAPVIPQQQEEGEEQQEVAQEIVQVAGNQLIGQNALERRGALSATSFREMLLNEIGGEAIALGLLEPFTPEYFRQQIEEVLEVLHEDDNIDVDEIEDPRERRAAGNANRCRKSTEYIHSALDNDLGFFWLADLVAFLKGDTGIQISLNEAGEPVVRKRNQELIDLIKHPAITSVIFLDATSNPQEFLDLIGEEVYHIQSVETAKANSRTEQEDLTGAELEIVQVLGCGLMGRNRSGNQEKISQAVADKLKAQHQGKVSVIDLKAFDKGEGIWHRDSRGSNAYQDNEAIILVGAPIPNLSAVTDEYAIVNGYRPDTSTVLRSYPIDHVGVLPGNLHPTRDMLEVSDIGLAAEIRKRTLQSYHQAFGRLRANRRPGESLTVYVVSDYPLDVPVTVLRKQDVLEQKTAADRAREALKDAWEKGLNLKSPQIADLAGVSNLTVRRLPEYKEYREAMKKLAAEIAAQAKVDRANSRKNGKKPGTPATTGIEATNRKVQDSSIYIEKGDVRFSGEDLGVDLVIDHWADRQSDRPISRSITSPAVKNSDRLDDFIDENSSRHPRPPQESAPVAPRIDRSAVNAVMAVEPRNPEIPNYDPESLYHPRYPNLTGYNAYDIPAAPSGSTYQPISSAPGSIDFTAEWFGVDPARPNAEWSGFAPVLDPDSYPSPRLDSFTDPIDSGES